MLTVSYGESLEPKQQAIIGTKYCQRTQKMKTPKRLPYKIIDIDRVKKNRIA